MKAFGFAGWSGAGKTTLIEQLIPRFTMRGIGVSVIKHAHHRFDVDTPGKDSWRHREAGAREILITAENRWVLMHELRGAPEPGLHAQLRRFEPVDLVLVEGYKSARLPKIEVHRGAAGKPLLAPTDPDIVAIASDVAERELRERLCGRDLGCLALDDVDGIADFVVAHPGLVIAS
ncbi:MAG: molybdopterin-guanine dinucleotide biosynthesis protein B [Lautropia sp.]